MYIRNYDEAQYELAGSKLAADTMVYRITSLGLSVLGILWTLGKIRKTEVYNLIHRDYTTVSHNMTALIKDGYVHKQVISHKTKYLSLTGKVSTIQEDAQDIITLLKLYKTSHDYIKLPLIVNIPHARLWDIAYKDFPSPF